jgi:hypothetical protein
MRSDMFEVIIERPRVQPNRRGRRKGRKGEALRQQEAPVREPMSRGRGGNKILNENLAPLRRFLQRRVGRPWNDVHREICALLNVRSAVQKHVLDHVDEMVEVNVVLVGGRAHHAPGHLFAGSLIVRSRWRGFYVCPKTGTLRLSPYRWGRGRIDPRTGSVIEPAVPVRVGSR